MHHNLVDIGHKHGIYLLHDTSVSRNGPHIAAAPCPTFVVTAADMSSGHAATMRGWETSNTLEDEWQAVCISFERPNDMRT